MGLPTVQLCRFTNLVPRCSTCNLNGFACPGHPGHIELPVPVYHASFLDQMIKLLRGKCAYCSHFKLAPIEVNRIVCKLQLLRFGLLNEAQEIDGMSLEQVGDTGSGEEEKDLEEQRDSIMRRRNKFVTRSIRQATGTKHVTTSSIEKVESLASERRSLIREFFANIGKPTKCGSCFGYDHASIHEIFPFFANYKTEFLLVGEKIDTVRSFE